MNIIQTWKDENIPAIYKSLSDKVKFYNPNWNYMFFTDADIDQFIQTKMPQHYSTFENFKQTWKERDTKWDSGLVLFLSESKHKIKKKAEQAACKMAIEVLK